MNYQEILKILTTFRDERGWQKYHNLKDLALSVNLEASEILEIFQWQDSSQKLDDKQLEHLKEEIADTLIYLFFMCDKLNIDPEDIIAQKMQRNQKRHWKINDDEL
ncbi:nucleotide pyrophosphohydrolase [Ligilactobacillus sp. Marseille-Q7487]|uniref:nucleotide pyrophosphohydrolase n=1 Tax=Ligilactobacillus sp. Marseille-Q7487 TaxID=3022128 RepID=UPI0024A9692A|nr:nucleotide pyrophosphohydrolase [Ligilactobacillus sp. Marseille-Q7487]